MRLAAVTSAWRIAVVASTSTSTARYSSTAWPAAPDGRPTAPSTRVRSLASAWIKLDRSPIDRDDAWPFSRGRHSSPVIFLEVIKDHFGVRLCNGGTEGLDHLVDLCLPDPAGWKRRVHNDVIKTVAAAAIRFNLIETSDLLELNRLFASHGGYGK